MEVKLEQEDVKNAVAFYLAKCYGLDALADDIEITMYSSDCRVRNVKPLVNDGFPVLRPAYAEGIKNG